jgi:hypothetical protein
MTSRFVNLWIWIISITSLCALSGCDDEPAAPDNVAIFESTELGFEGTETAVKVTLSRAVKSDVPVTITLAPDGVTYGTDFTTVPDGSSGALTLTIPSGSAEASFSVIKPAGVFLSGGQSIAFTLSSAGDPVLVGETASLKLSFSAIVSDGSQLQLNGLISTEAGSSAGNSVFVDLSNNQQTSIARTKWDLGFYGGSDFRVIINNTTGASVVAVNKTDLTQVTAADVNADDLKVGQAQGSFAVIDDVFGDISKTAIPAISATDADNKVYVINRAGGAFNVTATSDFVKIRVLRTASGYTLQYAKINETTIKSLSITKDAGSNFSYVSFDEGAVAVEPARARWDIEWTFTMFYTQNPPVTGPNVPYSFSDIVLINHLGGTQAAEVLTSTGLTYDSFNESNLPAITLKGERNVIGAGWRDTAPPTPVGVRTNRFYVIKDPAGNIYKLKFVSFHANDGGTRGKPVIEYKLVKKAS